MSFAPQPLPLLPPHEQLESSETTRQKDVKKHKENIRNFVHVTGVEAEGDLMQMDNVQRMMPPPALVPQQAPPPSLFLATYNNVKVYEMHVNNVQLMRRVHVFFVNTTQILNLARVPKTQRTNVITKEILPLVHEKVQGGYGKYQGTWTTLENGKALAIRYNVDDLCRPLFDFNPTETQIHSLSVFRRNLPSPNKRQQLVAKDDLSVKKRTTEKLGGQGGVVGTISSSSVTTRPRSKSSSAASLLSAAANAHHIVYPTPIHTPAGSNTPAGSTSPMKGVGGAGGGTLVGPTFTIPTYHHQQQPQQQFPRPLNQHSVRGAVSSALVASSLKFSHMSDLPSTCEEMDEERTTNSTHFMNSNSSNLDVEDNMMVIDVDETSASSSFSASSNSSVAPSVAAIKQPFYVVYEKDNAAAAARNGGQTSSTIAASTSPHLNHTTMHHHNHLQQQHLREQSASALLSLEQIPVIEMEDVLLSIYLSDDPSKLRAFFHYRLYSNSNSASIPASTSPSSATTSILPSPLKHTPSAATTARVYRQILETKLDMAGNTLLHWACILGRRTILQSLIYDYGANLSILNNQGQTPLITAVNHTYNYTFQTFPDLLRLFDRVVLEPSDCSVATGVMINGGGGNDAAAVASSSSSVSFSSSSSSSSSTTPLLAKHIKRRKEEQGRTILHHIVELGSIKGKVLASRYYLGCLAHWIDESLGKLDEHRAQAQEERDRRQNEIEAEIHRRRTEARMAALQAAVVSSSRTNRGKVPRGGIIASIESLSPTRRQEIIDQVDATLNQTLRPLTSTLRQTLLAAVSSSLSSGARAPIARKSTAAISTFLDRRCKRLGDTALHRACVVGDPEIIHWLISLGTCTTLANRCGLTARHCMVRSVRLRSMLVGWFGLGESDFESLLRQVDVIEEKMAEVDTGLLLAGMMAAATASSTSSSGHEEEEHVGVEDDINVGNSNNKQHDVKSHHYSLSSSSSAISALASSLQLSSLHQKISSTATTPERVTSSGGFTSSTNNNNPIEINLGSIDFGNEDGDDETQVDDDEVDECLHVAQQYVMDAVESTRYAVMNKMGRIENSRSSTSHSVCRESGVAWTSAAMPMMEHDAPPLVSNMIPISTRGALFSNSPMLKDMMSSTDSSFSSLSRSWPLSSSLLSMGGGGGGSPERELDEYSSASSTQPQQQHQHQFSSHNPSPSMSPKTVVDQEINTYRNLHHSLLRSYGVSANTESNSNAGISNKSSGNRKRAIAVDDDLNGDLIDGDVSWASQVLIQK